MDTWTIIGRYRWRIDTRTYASGAIMAIGIVETIDGAPVDQWGFKTPEQAQQWAERICYKFNAFERYSEVSASNYHPE